MVLNDDKQLCRRIDDLVSQNKTRGKSQFLGFLDERQIQLAKDYLLFLKISGFRFFGGKDGTERCYLGIDYQSEIKDSDFPISALRLTYRKQDCLTHRDFLGAFMALGISRDGVGDILVARGETVVFLSHSVASFAKNQLAKVGKVGVKVETTENTGIQIEKSFETIQGTVASLRLDCVVSLICCVGRKEAKELILGKVVFLNHRACQNIDNDVSLGDNVSIRGYGKFVLEVIGSPTKKGRIHVKIKHFI